MDVWAAAWAAVEVESRIEIVAPRGFERCSFHGSYLLARVGSVQGPAPSFRCGVQGRWLYYDTENRWRVGIALHMKARRAGNVGYLKSSPVRPGLLPTEGFIHWEVCRDGWIDCGSLQVTGVKTPDLIVTLHIRPGEERGSATITCNSISGTELLSLHVDPDTNTIAYLRDTLAEQPGCHKCTMVMPDGRLLSDSDDMMLIASTFGEAQSSRYDPLANHFCATS